jgi:hypothetical protein
LPPILYPGQDFKDISDALVIGIIEVILHHKEQGDQQDEQQYGKDIQSYGEGISA